MCLLFILDLNKSSDDKFLYLVGSELQSYAAIFIIYRTSVAFFATRIWQLRRLYLRIRFMKTSFIMGAERPLGCLQNSIINF